MSVEQEIDNAYAEAGDNYDFISKLIELNPPKSDNDYININRAYFRMGNNFYQSIMMLLGEGKPYPSIVILRSMIEVFTKAIYLEFIEKPKGTNIIPMISGDNGFPSFVNMSKELDKFMSENPMGPDNFFGYLHSRVGTHPF
ncbi:hypothetical protein [Enterobacter cloacae]|uniref:hypothetical protein n=1 Tax=Enterobacter cloacae TaxID=550 RepID=UPI003906B297